MSVTNLDLEDEKEQILHVALSKICRDLGEDEDKNIVLLRENCDIYITNTPIPLCDPNYLAFLIEEPFSLDLISTIKADFGNTYQFYKKHIKYFSNNDLLCIQYPKLFRLDEIDEIICGTLENEHEISDSYLIEYAWEELQNSELWKKARIQVARELIAYKFKNNLFEDTMQGIETSI